MIEPVVTADEAWELPEGTEIAPGRTTLKALGGGHDYEVYLVWDDRLFAIMVAKLVRPHLVEHERTLRRLRREAEALQTLAHPVLLRGFGAELAGPYPHVLVEHLEGPTLRRLIRRGGPLPIEQSLPLALHVAAALHYMAAEKMVHLDVKPDNIVMGIPPRLIDLSVARSLESARELASPVGTDAYMAPEQCEPGSAGEIGPAADVWGLGATLFHALAGQVPFPSDDDERFPQLHEEPRELPDYVPRDLREAVFATLRKDPAERPTAAELALSLQPLVAELPTKVRLGKPGGR